MGHIQLGLRWLTFGFRSLPNKNRLFARIADKETGFDITENFYVVIQPG